MSVWKFATLRARYKRALARLTRQRRWAAVNLLIVRWYGWLERQTLPAGRVAVYDAELAE